MSRQGAWLGLPLRTVCIGMAAAVRERRLQRTATFLKRSVEAGLERDARIRCRGQIAFDEGVRRQMAFDPKRTVRAVTAIGKGLIALGLSLASWFVSRGQLGYFVVLGVWHRDKSVSVFRQAQQISD